jgi:hypothetical protein
MLVPIIALFGLLLLAKAFVSVINRKRKLRNNKTKFRQKMKRQ